jgi:hypothetical protein
MTQFVRSTDMPDALLASFTNFEQMTVWALLALSDLYRNLPARETVGSTADPPSVEVTTFTDRDYVDRMVIRISLPLRSDYKTFGGKLWMAVQSLGAGAIPAGFKVP